MVDPIVSTAIVALIQVVAQLAKQQGLSVEQMNQHFLESWKKVQDRPASELPDAE